MTAPEPRHAAPTRRRPRVLDLALVLVVALVFGGICYSLGAAQTQRPPAPAAVQSTALADGDPVKAGDGKLYYFRGFHLEGTFQHRHPLVSDTRTGTPKIAPGLTVTAVVQPSGEK